MPFLTKEDLNTHIYPEITDVITRSNDDIVTKCINSGLAEIKSYLNRFDLLAIFGNDTTEPTYTNEHLKTIAKDIVCWHLVKLANPNINLELFRTAYEDAIKFLTQVMKGIVDPGYPLRTDTENPDLSSNIFWESNRKRIQHW